ncbi:hypothetical protein GCM10007880_13350 [Mesorhizobium amorphae]|uniref:Uncharacterized protein n=2 Tax=Mesorhizobium TaxID=68287 RepID=G6YFG5_9HYPH|nr:hypothetical protein A6B35_25310 [Mesorhizobium amorphae CCNWGS0123]EHH09553.1 hypothetical protein MEA186_23591 [Mesorhizobium amorphae CCNWGS0123]RJT39183.1 hypothetical protein D3227_13295 [Mesorhizobium waimense]GLR40819.1 hypothetical protein GCM10007880_13350 [Mesorhizobium amorphae]
MSLGEKFGRWRRPGGSSDEPGAAVPKHELEHIMRLGRLNRDQALALLTKFQGDREAMFADLASLRKQDRQKSEDFG